MTDFNITISDKTKTANCLLWQGVVRAENEVAAHEALQEEIIPRLERETGAGRALMRILTTEIAPLIAPDLVAA